MPPETWVIAAAALLLVAAAIVEAAAVAARTGPRWLGLAVIAAAAGALAVAVVLMAVARPSWSPSDLRQSAITLAAAALLIYLLLAFRLDIGGAGLVVALVALGLILFGWLAVGPGGLDAVPPAAAVQVQWFLFLVGGGGALVAGSAGLSLAVRACLIGRARGWAWPRRAGLHRSLFGSAALAAFALGAGLIVGVWWAWQATGLLVGGDPREVWMVAAWLVVTMSLWTGRLGERAGRWAAILAVVAAVLTTTGLLAAPDLIRILGL
jgi:hypothetical protein